MAGYHPADASSLSIVRPRCRKCGARMALVRIEPDTPGHEIRAPSNAHAAIIRSARWSSSCRPCLSPGCACGASSARQHAMPIEQDERARLRKRIIGMRSSLLLFANDPRAASGLRDLSRKPKRDWQRRSEASLAGSTREMTRVTMPDRGDRTAKARVAAAEVRKRANSRAVELRPIIAGL